MMTYTVHRLNTNGSLSHKQHLNDLDELNTWLVDVYGKFATIFIIQDQTGKTRTMTDNGEEWVNVQL